MLMFCGSIQASLTSHNLSDLHLFKAVLFNPISTVYKAGFFICCHTAKVFVTFIWKFVLIWLISYTGLNRMEACLNTTKGNSLGISSKIHHYGIWIEVHVPAVFCFPVYINLNSNIFSIRNAEPHKLNQHVW